MVMIIQLHSMDKEMQYNVSVMQQVAMYSTPRGKTDKLEEPVNREPNVTRR